MTWKPSLAIAVGGILLAGTALAQAPGGSGGSGAGAPGPSSGGAMTPSTPGTGANPCPPGQTMEGNTCAPSRVQGDQSSRSTEKSMDKSMEKQSRSMEKNGTDKQQVRMVQEALKDKGYDPGAIDGSMGPRTSAALRDFQQAEGLRATGRLDAETRTKLGI